MFSVKYSNPAIFGPKRIFEVDSWKVSEFVVKELVPVVEFAPYPLEELCLMVSAVCYFKPDIIIEWGTHLGKSARIFYEIISKFNLKTEIYSIDLPPSVSHPENIVDKRGHFVKGIGKINLINGDSIIESKKIIDQRKKATRYLFFLDGDHGLDRVFDELTYLHKIASTSCFLIHDTIYLGKYSGCSNGPYRAVNKFIKNIMIKGKYFRKDVNSGKPGMTLLLHI